MYSLKLGGFGSGIFVLPAVVGVLFCFVLFSRRLIVCSQQKLVFPWDMHPSHFFCRTNLP